MTLKGIEDLKKKLQKLDGTKRVPLPEILTPEFISEHTRFASVEEMFNSSDFKIDSVEDFKNIPDDAWDRYISSESSFASWGEMLSAANAIWIKKQLR